MLRASLMKGIAAALILTGASTAQAMSAGDADAINCLSQDSLKTYLDRAWNEGRVAVGQLENGNKVALYASRRGSWTLVEHRPDGQSCVHASGTQMKMEQAKNAKRTPAS